MLEKFMKEITKELELGGPLASEVPGVYVLRLGEEFEIYISSPLQGIYMECTFPFTSSHQEELFMHLLLANLFGQGTNGVVIGLTEDGKALKLSRLVGEASSYKLFKEVLEDFINAADFWSEEVLSYK